MTDKQKQKVREEFFKNHQWLYAHHPVEYGRVFRFLIQKLEDQERELVERIDRLEKEEAPQHAEQNGYECALYDVKNSLKQDENNSRTDTNK